VSSVPLKRPSIPTVSRTYSYDAREPDIGVALSMPGIDYLRGIIRGDYPAAPIAATLGFAPVEGEHGRVVFEGTPQRYTYNPLGAVHGGWAATILDSAMACAVHTTLPAGRGYTTIDLSIKLVRAMTERTGVVHCEGRVVHTGGTMVTAEGRITGVDGTLYAHGTTTCLILAPR
jgi:uncharacterized protein (TIGR00369 family)